MVYSLSYQRPARSVAAPDSLSTEDKARSISESIESAHDSTRLSSGIPEALSFDKILEGGTCPPCALRDFLNYLKYIELSAENLQFFLWFRDYERRFNELSESEKALAPEWTVAQETGVLASEKKVPLRHLERKHGQMFQGTDFDGGPKMGEPEKIDPFATPPRSAHGDVPAPSLQSGYDGSTSAIHHAKNAETAFEDAGLKWQPFSVQPYREEVSRIISIYIAEGGARELNLSSKERIALLHALENTTHPSAFRSVNVSIEWSLRCQAHPNFIRWTICNGNRPRVQFARALGVGGIVGGLTTGVLITLSSAGRGWRVMCMIGLMIGISTLIAAWKGMCVVLHGMHHRHLRPWELFVEDNASEFEVRSETPSSVQSNSFEDEPWVAKYERRFLIRKIFDREVWVQEPALRQIQDTIFLQAILGALILSAIGAGIFCAVPAGGLY